MPSPGAIRVRSSALAALALAALASAGCSETPANAGTPPPSVAAPAPVPAPPAASASASPSASAAAPAPVPAAPPAGARIYSKARFAWIQPSPSAGPNAWIGYVALGGSVPLRGGSVESARVRGGGRVDCEWYAVEPRGFVCAGRDATVDPADPAVVALRPFAADVESPWPYQYGESIGAPRYASLPSEAEQRKTEIDLDRHLERVRRVRALAAGADVASVSKVLVGVDLSPAGAPATGLFPAGPNVREARPFVASGSTVAWTRAVDAGERSWLVSWDHALIPKDRVRPYARSDFQGVELGERVRLPIAFFRKTARPKYRRAEGGAFVRSGDEWPVRSWVALSGEEVTDAGAVYLATSEPGTFAAAADATVVRAADRAPFTADDENRERRKWLEISILGGWMIAYEGTTPVFATLIAPGRGGPPAPGVDPLETASTPVGTFRVDGKFRTATMVSSTNDQIVHTEVQFVQNFSGPHALHGAYWHDAWGEGKSGGCVNLSPRDAQRIFAWTDPELPEGWHGMKTLKDMGPPTRVVIHR